MSNQQEKWEVPWGYGMKSVVKKLKISKDYENINVLFKTYRLMIIIVIFAIGSAAFSIVGPKILGKATAACLKFN